MKNKLCIYDIGAANFLPEHFPLKSELVYVHFEPDARGLNALKQWLKLKQTNANHIFFNQAVGEKSKIAKLELASKNTSSSIVEPGFDGEHVDVSVAPLNSLILEHKLPFPDVIKIDVEGYELEVLSGIDLQDQRIKVVEVEVTLNSGKLSEVITMLSTNSFQLSKLRTHGDQKYNPRNWFRGKLHGLSRKLKLANYGVIRSEESWSKPTTPLTQIEFVFTRGIDLYTEDPIERTICDIYGLAHRKSASDHLKCGQRKADLLSEFTLIR